MFVLSCCVVSSIDFNVLTLTFSSPSLVQCLTKLFSKVNVCVYFCHSKQLEGHYFYGHFGTGGEEWPLFPTQAAGICDEKNLNLGSHQKDCFCQVFSPGHTNAD